MDLSNLKPAEGSIKNRKRIARGQGSGKGGTSTRGHKGAQSRSGYSRKEGFEGGQMPLYRRVPKFGFKNINRKEFTAVNVGNIQKLVDKTQITTIDKEVLIDNGLVKKNEMIKILGDGELTAKINISANSFSAKAKETIESLGGTITKI